MFESKTVFFELNMLVFCILLYFFEFFDKRNFAKLHKNVP